MSKLTTRFPYLRKKIELKIWQLWLGAALLPIIARMIVDLSKWLID